MSESYKQSYRAEYHARLRQQVVLAELQGKIKRVRTLLAKIERIDNRPLAAKKERNDSEA